MPCAAPGSAPSAFDTESLKVALWLWFVPETPVIGVLYGVGDGSLVARPHCDIGRVPPVCGSCRDGLTANLHDGGHFAVNGRLTLGISGGLWYLARERGVNRATMGPCQLGNLQSPDEGLWIAEGIDIPARDLLTPSPTSPPYKGERCGGLTPPYPPKAARLLGLSILAPQAAPTLGWLFSSG